ncbi:MAG TPA: alpha/beta hydrolase domain-containing protein [Steroidobacteraceae bacterium]
MSAALGLAAIQAFASSSLPVPQVSGPITASDIPGAPSHNYTFFASNHNLASHGYLEEEFFIKGTARTYNIPPGQTGTVKDSGLPYFTRIVVRRPADQKRFNGTVLVEWDNVTNQFDAENFWFFGWEHIMRGGYAWVGVSTQTIGVAALKKWSPQRYGALDVGEIAANTGPNGEADRDAMSYDIFSQASQALRHPGDVDMLNGLKPKLYLAVGESQSAARLSTYVNSIHPLARVYDGFLLLSALGGSIRGDLLSPVLKLDTEYDVIAGEAAARKPDTPKFRTWEVAGTSHVDQHLRASREAVELRDNGVSLEANLSPLCAVPSIGTRVPTNYVVASALDKLAVWAAGGPPPPTAPRLSMTQILQRPDQSVIDRDKDGLAEGGIRLAALAVPTQFNVGISKAAHPDNGPSREAIGSGACVRWGYSTDMTIAQLNAHYPSHAAYVAQVRRVTADNVEKGYILAADAVATIRQAEESHAGEH